MVPYIYGILYIFIVRDFCLHLTGPTPLPMLEMIKSVCFCKSGLPLLSFANGEEYIFDLKQKSWHSYSRLPSSALQDLECLSNHLSDLEVGRVIFF